MGIQKLELEKHYNIHQGMTEFFEGIIFLKFFNSEYDEIKEIFSPLGVVIIICLETFFRESNGKCEILLEKFQTHFSELLYIQMIFNPDM